MKRIKMIRLDFSEHLKDRMCGLDSEIEYHQHQAKVALSNNDMEYYKYCDKKYQSRVAEKELLEKLQDIYAL